MGLHLAIFALAVILATGYAIFQPLDPDAIKQPSFGTWRWWRYPGETNAFARLASGFPSDIRLCGVPGTQKVYALGSHTVIASDDGGLNWYAPSLPQLSGGAGWELTAGFFLDSNHGWLFGDNGFLTTADGGSTWIPTKTAITTGVLQAQFISAQEGWICSLDGIFHTIDGGAIWTNINKGYRSVAFHYSDPKHGVSVGKETTNFGDLYNTPLLETATNNGQFPGTADKTLAATAYPSTPMFFSNTIDGWYFDANGTTYITTTGGKLWTPGGIIPLNKKDNEFIRGDYFLDNLDGWVFTTDDHIFRTFDGGIIWTRLSFNYSSGVSNLYFVTADTGFVTTSQGMVYSTRDGGTTWCQRTQPRIEQLDFLTNKLGFMVDVSGNIWKTSDGGQSWHFRSRPTDTPWGIAFETEMDGWSYDGGHNVILRTQDGGSTWQRAVLPWASQICGLSLTSGSGVWFITLEGVVYIDDSTLEKERDAATGNLNVKATLSYPTSQSNNNYSVFFNDDTHGWASYNDDAPNVSPSLWQTTDGKIWVPVHPQSQEFTLTSLSSLRFVDVAHGFAIANLSFPATTADGGRTWSKLKVNPFVAFPGDLSFDSITHGWASDESNVYETSNGGQTWTPTPVPQRVANLDIVPGQGGSSQVFAYSNQLQFPVFKFESGSKVPETITPAPSRLPGRWFYALLCVCSVTLVLVIRGDVTAARPLKVESIEEIFARDSPLQYGDSDALGLTQIANGLSYFLINSSTIPPVTIAVNGAWGSGKTSLLQLLKSDLDKRNQRTVWFNAWHHQQEDQLFAALLQNILDQAVPPLTSASGIALRVKLLWKRARRYWLGAILLCFVFAGAISFVIPNPVRNLQLLSEFVTLLSSPANAFHQKTVVNWSQVIVSRGLMVAIWTGIVAPAGVFVKNMRPFATAAIKALSSVNPGSNTKDLAASAGIHERFSRDFHDVTEKLKPSRLTIFIDDLDRCEPNQVMTTLKATNFLAASGECFVVFGLERSQVRRAVALSNLELTKFVGPDNESQVVTEPENEIDRRRLALDQAEKYLEKLINLEIQIPVMEANAAENILATGNVEKLPANEIDRRKNGSENDGFTMSDSGCKATSKKGGQKTNAYVTDLSSKQRKGLATTKAGIAISSFILLLGLVWSCFLYWGGSIPISNPVPVATPLPTTTVIPSPEVQTSPTAPGATPTPIPTAAPNQWEQPVPRPSTTTIWWATLYPPLFVIVIGAAAGPLCWLYYRNKLNEQVANDSPEFKFALRALTAFITSNAQTPRQLKRFLNRVRYYAMSRRAFEAFHPWDERMALAFLNRGRMKSEEQTDAETLWKIDETSLVALAAIEFAHSSWLDDERLFSDFDQFISTQAKDQTILGIDGLMSLSVTLTPGDRDKFLRLSVNVRAT